MGDETSRKRELILQYPSYNGNYSESTGVVPNNFENLQLPPVQQSDVPSSLGAYMSLVQTKNICTFRCAKISNLTLLSSGAAVPY